MERNNWWGRNGCRGTPDKKIIFGGGRKGRSRQGLRIFLAGLNRWHVEDQILSYLLNLFSLMKKLPTRAKEHIPIMRTKPWRIARP